jgi:2-polyprenyl-3-methyl-5-hydroxy-6-metoxy-1,4-benzoquinol methylase
MNEAQQPAIADQKKYWETWNATLRDPQNLNDWCERRAGAILNEIKNLGLVRPTIMDLGCGTGWLSDKLRALGPTTGVDLAEDVIAAAAERYPAVRFMSGDIFRLELRREAYDVVVSQEVIAHVVDQAEYLELACRLLKPGGYLVLTTPNKYVVERAGFPAQPPEHIERWLTMRKLRKLVSVRFKVLRSRTLVPQGHQGLLRVTNSHRLNKAFDFIFGRTKADAVKEWLGLGFTLLVVAQKTG